MCHPLARPLFLGTALIDHIISTCFKQVLIPYSLNILRGKIFADFVVLGVISENFILEIFIPPYSLIHFGSVCKSAKNLFLATLLNLIIFTLEIFRLYGNAIVKCRARSGHARLQYLVISKSLLLRICPT